MKYIGLPLLLVAGALLAACAVKPAPKQSASTAPPQATAIQANVLRATLKNGLRVVIVRDAFAPVATQQITYFVGSNQAPKGFPGMAHAQEHMMFRGAPGLSRSQLNQIIARLGGNMNAFTAHGFTWYYFTVASDDLDVAMHVGSQRMAGVDDSEAQWKKERGAIEQEVAGDHSNPGYVLSEKLDKHLFAGTPYSHGALGTRASFDKTTAAMLKAFHDKWYAPNNALLVITGDVNPAAALAKVKKLYGKIPAKMIPAKRKITFAPVAMTTLTTKTDRSDGYVELAFRMPGYRSPDYPAAEIAADVLSSQRGPIAALYYEGKALGSSFSYGKWTHAGIGTLWATFPANGNPKALKQDLINALKKVLKNGVSPDLIVAAKRRIVLGQELKRNSIHGLANAWSNAIARLGLRSPEEAAARLRAVTPAEVNAEIRKTLDLNHAITLIAYPTPGAKPKHQKSSGGAESFSGNAGQKPVKLPNWAVKAFAKLPHPKPFLHPTDMMLPNGIRLIVQPLKTGHWVGLMGVVNNNSDLQAPKGQEGVSGLLDSLFAWGPEGMTRKQFEAEKDALGIELYPGYGFALYALPKQFDAGVKLLSDVLLHPALPKKAFEARQKVLAKQVAGRVNSPLFKFRQTAAHALLPKGDPGLRYATEKSVSGLTLDDVKAYYDQVFRPDETTIVAIGEITPAKAKAVVEKYFGDWEGQGPKPDLNLPSIPPSLPTSVLVPDQSRVQNVAELAETLNLTRENPAHFALVLANTYLSGGFYASPLMHELREKRGLVYSVGSSAAFSRYRGFFYLSFGAYPSKTKEARKVALEVLDKVISKPLTHAQLHLAKSIILRKIQLAQQNVYAIGNGWLGRSQDHLPLDWNYVAAHHYEELTAPEIRQTLKKYLDPTRLSTFILGPPKQ